MSRGSVSRGIRQEGGDVGDEDVRRSRDHDRDGLCGLGTAPARHARRRTAAVIASRQFVGGARFALTRLKTPDALNVSNATMIARANRDTTDRV